MFRKSLLFLVVLLFFPAVQVLTTTVRKGAEHKKTSHKTRIDDNLILLPAGSYTDGTGRIHTVSLSIFHHMRLLRVNGKKL